MKNRISKNKRLTVLKNVAVLFLASLLFAGGMELFLIPNSINIGGFIGIAQLLSFIPQNYFSNGILFILLNIPVLILAGFYFSKQFVLRTTLEVILSGAFMELFYRLNLSQLIGLSDKTNLTLIALSGGVLVATGIAATFSIEGSTGGTDIIGLIIQKRFKISSVLRLFLIFDAAVILIYSIVLKNSNVLFYSLTTLVAYQIALEIILNGISNAVMLEIVTTDSEKLIEAISEKLERGSTMFKAMGTYTKEEKEVIVCVVRKRQITEARALIKSAAPDSFAYSVPIKEVMGKGFRNLNL